MLGRIRMREGSFHTFRAVYLGKRTRQPTVIYRKYGPAKPQPTRPPRVTSPGRPNGRTARCNEAPRHQSHLSADGRLADRRGDDLPRLLLDRGEMLGAAEGLGVQLVDVFGARRAGGEPAGRGDDLEPADRGAVARRGGQRRDDLLACELTGGNLRGGELSQGLLLFPAGRGVDARVGRVPGPGC